jgi:exopolysaccharide biosynthesis polyprenyl glycosylphosphotransferase
MLPGKLAALEAAVLFGAAWAVLPVAAATDWRVSAAETAVLAVCVVLAFHYADLYDPRAAVDSGEWARRVLPAIAGALGLLVVASALMPAMRAGQSAAAERVAMMLALGLAVRVLSWSLFHTRAFVQRVLILGTSPLAVAVAREVANRDDRGYVVALVTEEPVAPGPAAPAPVVGHLGELPAVLARFRPDRVVVAARQREQFASELLEFRARGVHVEDAAETYERLTGKLAIESLTPSTLLFGRGFRRSRLRTAVRRAASVVVGAVALVAMAPLLLLIALAIRLESGGSVLFVQDRIGLGGRRFQLLKFRTMHPTTAATSEWAADNAHRITTVGRWLRRFRLDELPQLVNVVRGDMALIGPRPHPVSNEELFARAIPYYSLRASVAPGITGWAQIRYGYANNLDEETEKMRYDLYYIKHQSLWLDLRIAVDTVKAVLVTTSEEGSDQPALIDGARPAAPLPPAVERDAA